MVTIPVFPPIPGYRETRIGGESVHEQVFERSINRELNEVSAKIKAQSDRSDFVDDRIAEMPTLVYSQ